MTVWKSQQPEPARFPSYRVVDEAGNLVATVPIMADNKALERLALITAAPAMLSMLKWLEEITDVPERNCSCHISPPCSDCVEYGAIREAMENTRTLIAKAEGRA